MNVIVFSLILAGFVTIAGGVTDGEESVSLLSSPSGKEITPELTNHDNMSRQPAAKTLSLPDALALALTHNPELAVFSYEMRIREAGALRANLLPNPEIDAAIENFAGSNSLNGFQGSELTLSLGQLIELSGKRQKRTRVAELDADLAGWDYQVAKLSIFADVKTAFTAVLALQKRIDIQQEQVNFAETFLHTVKDQVNAGRVSPAEVARASVEYSMTKIDLDRLHKEFLTARRKLAAAWGDREPDFDRVVGNLDTVYSLPPLENLLLQIAHNPAVSRRTVEIQQREAELTLEKARRVPDPVISGGYRRLNESGDNAFVMGLSLPLLLFNRNKESIQIAQYRQLQAEQQKRAVEIALNVRLTEIYHSLEALNREIGALKAEVIPEATNAFDMINAGYQKGRFGFLNVLDAQRTLFEVRTQYLNVLQAYHQNVAELERLMGNKLDSFQ